MANLTVVRPTSTTPSVRRSMLRTVERVLLRDGGQRTALHNARSAVLENELKAFDRAEAQASLERLALTQN